MPDHLPPRYLRTPEAASFVGLSIRTLEKHRSYGTGPRIRSSAAASSTGWTTCRWVELGAKRSTFDPGVGMVLPAKPHATLPPAHAGQARR
jgi:hypothetical protein